MKKYVHLERLGHRNNRGVDLGTCHIFPKLDGTNARIQVVDHEIVCGSRNRELTAEDDHFGFQNWATQPAVAQRIKDFVSVLGSNVTLYGEWLVPHTLKTYREDAWRKFYLFDVLCEEKGQFLHLDVWNALAQLAGLNPIQPIAIADSPSNEQLLKLVESNTYLICDGAGVGEGIVVKNYAWENFEGKQVWGKIVKNEFREQNSLVFGASKVGEPKVPEVLIVNRFVTPTLVNKERAKLQGLERRQLIPRLFQTVFYCLVTEELWTALKETKFPTVDFRKLQSLTTLKVKEFAEDLF